VGPVLVVVALTAFAIHWSGRAVCWSSCAILLSLLCDPPPCRLWNLPHQSADGARASLADFGTGELLDHETTDSGRQHQPAGIAFPQVWAAVRSGRGLPDGRMGWRGADRVTLLAVGGVHSPAPYFLSSRSMYRNTSLPVSRFMYLPWTTPDNNQAQKTIRPPEPC
jgi:hypothetical protein